MADRRQKKCPKCPSVWAFEDNGYWYCTQCGYAYGWLLELRRPLWGLSVLSSTCPMRSCCYRFDRRIQTYMAEFLDVSF